MNDTKVPVFICTQKGKFIGKRSRHKVPDKLKNVLNPERLCATTEQLWPMKFARQEKDFFSIVIPPPRL